MTKSQAKRIITCIADDCKKDDVALHKLSAILSTWDGKDIARMLALAYKTRLCEICI